MARVELNPRFEEISGRMKDVVLYTSYNRTLMRRYVVPRNPDTVTQRLRRELFAGGVALWQSLSAKEQHRWNRKAAGRSLCGYNMCIASYMRRKTAGDISALLYTKLLKAISVSSHTPTHFDAVSLCYLGLSVSTSSMVVSDSFWSEFLRFSSQLRE